MNDRELERRLRARRKAANCTSAAIALPLRPSMANGGWLVVRRSNSEVGAARSQALA